MAGFWFKELLRLWAEHAALLYPNAPNEAAQFTCCAIPACYLFAVPAPPGVDDPHRRVLFSPHIEVDNDGLWLLDDAAE
ncbi:hypothetical protein OG559_22690 [Micromonospora sp. NBC_01405]|uniref:hypothetical protein n=1 Tax=Micromonospora sp. NBC_01405 TaxID=2903589 RepID=UPI0032525120